MEKLSHRVGLFEGKPVVVQFNLVPYPTPKYGAEVIPLTCKIDEAHFGVANCSNYEEAYAAISDYLANNNGGFVDTDNIKWKQIQSQ